MDVQGCTGTFYFFNFIQLPIAVISPPVFVGLPMDQFDQSTWVAIDGAQHPAPHLESTPWLTWSSHGFSAVGPVGCFSCFFFACFWCILQWMFRPGTRNVCHVSDPKISWPHLCEPNSYNLSAEQASPSGASKVSKLLAGTFHIFQV